MDELELQEFLDNWSKRKCEGLDGKSFDELFEIEGIPLWWFCRKFFYLHSIARQINPFKNILADKKLSMADRTRLYFGAKILRRFMWSNENKKIRYIKRYMKKNKNKEKTHEQEQKGRVLFLTYSNHLLDGGKIFRIENVVQKIKKDGKFKEFVLFVDALSSREHKKIAGFGNLYRYYNDETAEKARIISKEIMKKWNRISDDAKKEMFCFGEKQMWDYFKYPISFFFSKEFLYFLVMYYEMFKKIIRKEHVKAAVITGATSLFEKCLMAAAKQTNTPVVRIDHGLKYDIRRHADMIGNAKEAVMSEHAKRNLAEIGADEKRIAVVGPVVYDDIVSFIGAKKKKERNALIATAPMAETSRIKKRKYFERILKIVDDIERIDGTNIRLKLHPMEKYYEDYAEMLKGERYANVKVFKQTITREEFYGLIKWCDSFIQFGSNTAIEAMIIDRPVITVNLFDRDFRMLHWLEGSDAVIEVNYKDDVGKAVERSIKEDDMFREKRKKIVRKYAGEVDGKASERVAELIYGMIE